MAFALGLFDAVFHGYPHFDLGGLICGGACGGAIYGYIAGVLIAGVFLTRDGLERVYRRRFPPKDEEP